MFEDHVQDSLLVLADTSRAARRNPVAAGYIHQLERLTRAACEMLGWDYERKLREALVKVEALVAGE